MNIFGENQVESFRDIPSLVQANALQTDIIRWGVNYALNFCYIGMNSAISKNLKDIKPSLNKINFLLISKLSSFFNYILSTFDKSIARRDYKIFIDDQDYSGQYSLIHIANSPYFAGKKTGAIATAVPNDGLFDIALIKSSNPLRTLFSTKKYLRGKRPSNGIYIQAKNISVQSKSQMWIQLDNEYFQDTNIKLSLVNHALQFVAVNNLSYPETSVGSLRKA